MSLNREIGLAGATMMGLGSIVGTGVFVSIGIAAGVAGAGVVLAILLAAVVAMCNALSSAQLAANHPVSGGTYEYGYRYLAPSLGFAAGWTFLCAKTASAASAALGFSGYLLNMLGRDSQWLAPVAVGAVAALGAVVLCGIRISNRVNAVIVAVTLTSLAAFVVGGLPDVSLERLQSTFAPQSLLHATALMFVAYTGYARIATLSEEVREPRQTIPRAIIATLVISLVLYLAVAVVGVGAAGAQAMSSATSERAAPLETVSRGFRLKVHGIVAVGAITAMLCVLLNLILGLSRVLLAMGRRGDMPRPTTELNIAIIATCVAIAGLVATGNIATTWSFSAFSVLVYYAITNLAALRLTPEERLYSPAWAWVGLVACLLLAFSVEVRVWAAGLLLLGVGFVLRWIQSLIRLPR